MVGGAKVSDKIMLLNNLMDKVNVLVIGGGMAYTFLKVQGHEIGKSLFDAEKETEAKAVLAKAAEKGVKILLPVDHVCGKEFAETTEPVAVDNINIPADLMGLDIGPKTVAAFREALLQCKTIFWNGPMGVFEFENFAAGTRAMAQALADSGAITIVGGGDSAAAVEQMGFADKITHISTGGGASLEFLEGLELPGVACLLDK